MTRQSSFKRLVRARMEKTGERYAAARAALLAGEGPKGSDGAVLTVSEEAVRRRTGRGWEEWFGLLDEWGAVERPHKEIATWLREEQGVDGWSSQAVTERLFDAFTDAGERRRWLLDGEMGERTATRPRSARYDWEDGRTRVIAGFEAKGPAKSLVAIEHERLEGGEEAERMKAYWRERLASLKELLEAEG